MRVGSVVGFGSVLLVAGVACGGSDDAEVTAGDAGPDVAAPVATVDAGEDANDGGDAPPPPPPPGCAEDADSSLPDSAPCVVDSFAVFVDGPAGSDDDDGSKARPKKTIKSALAAAKDANKHRIYVCGLGPYAEALVPEADVRILGGYGCGSWKYDGTRARIAPTEAGPVLRLGASGAVSVVLSDLELQPLDIKARADGSSSIGIFALSSTLRLTRVAVTALDGAKGADGAVGAPGVFKTFNINEAGDSAGLAPGVCTCATGETTYGGYGENFNGGPATQGQLIIVGGTGAHGIPGVATNPGGAGDPGAPGKDASGSPTLGVLSETGWNPYRGADASEVGKVGQGGGGGGCGQALSSCAMYGLRGGSGACGGCGGTPGKGGAGGGSSFAVVLVNSSLSAVDSAFTTGAGAAGGKGGAGGKGHPGGTPNYSGFSPVLGGHGGKGGDGGSGAGGPGGLSIGVLFKGPPPILDEKTLGHITIGAAGPGGAGGVAANAGVAGKADKVLDVTKL